MNKSIAVPAKFLEKISQSNQSGCLVVSDPRDHSVSWKLYLNGCNLNYACSAVGDRERLTCLCQQFYPDLTPPQFTSENSEYENLYQWCLSKQFSDLEIEQFFLQLSQESLVQVLSFGKTLIEFDPNEKLERILINYPWRSLSEKNQALIHDWQKLSGSLLSPLTRIDVEEKNKSNFYSKFCKNLNQNLGKPESVKFFRSQNLVTWYQILSQKNCIYQIATQIVVSPLTIIGHLEYLRESEVINFLPFQEVEKQLVSVINSPDVIDSPVVIDSPAVIDSIDSRPVVACIDDSKTVQRQVKMTLESAGYQVVSITEPGSSLTILVREKPVLILMDINMPEIDGYELCKMLGRSRKLKDIPVVMLTGREKLSDRFWAKIVGAHDYLTKPFDPNELISVVRRLAKAKVTV